MRLEKVRLAEEPIDSFSARLRVAARRWFIEDIQLAKGAGRMTGQASVDPSTRQFQVANAMSAGAAIAKAPGGF